LTLIAINSPQTQPCVYNRTHANYSNLNFQVKCLKIWKSWLKLNARHIEVVW